jgi:glucose/arabinose dehydrogenase
MIVRHTFPAASRAALPSRYQWLLLFLLPLFFAVGCKKIENSIPPKQLDLKLVVDNLAAPITLVEAPDDSHRLFVVDQVGKVWIIDANGHKLAQPFLDISSKLVPLQPFYDERGLLSMAFHPNFKDNGKFYLFYNAPPPAGGPTEQTGNTGLPMTWSSTIRISEFKVDAGDDNKADLASERIILEDPHPQLNHNGGTIAFGPDGYLYISIGDGGNKNDIGPGHVEDWYKTNAGGNGQDIEKNLMGSILRININTSTKERNYGIPRDNPFVGKRGRNEVYAYGFRNPYRFSFDMGGSHRLFAGDAGQNLYEEVNVVVKGGNYGWNVKEATHCFNAADEEMELSSCPDKDAFGNPLLDPVIELRNLDHPNGGVTNAVVGGHVYRGHDIPGLQGQYIFGALSTDEQKAAGQLLVSTPGGGSGLWDFEKVNLKSFPKDLGQYVKGFGQDQSGEIYVLASAEIGPQGSTGKVYKLIPAINFGNQ